MASKAYKSSFYYFILSVLILSSCNSGFQYSIDTTLNPYEISPLTASLNIEAEKPVTATVNVLGGIPLQQAFGTNATNMEIPVVGLYPNAINKVVVTLDYEGGQIKDTIEITTKDLPPYFPKIVIDKLDRSRMESGMHACDIHFANKGSFNSGPFIFDDQGKVRWYLDLSSAGEMVSPFQRLKDGTLLMVSRNVIYEFDMLGKPLKKTTINPNYGMHHDVVELPDGNLLICVGKKNNFITVNEQFEVSDSDFIILFDRKNSKIVREWDVAKLLDVSRSDLNFFRPGDWLHMNGLAFDETDNSIVVSGKNQGLIKISWNNKLQWILAPNKSWGKAGRNGNGFETAPFVLTAIDSMGNRYPNSVQEGIESSDSFDYSWGTHAPVFMPNGNLLAFDNGTYRNFENKDQFSRAVEYQINEKDKTVSQVWQYGKERGQEFFSTIVSDVDYLSTTKNILATSGYIKKGPVLMGKIVEVDYMSGEEVFEATLYFKSSNGNKTSSWGQTDILYRSERMELRY
ncbi:MAG: aryl-sulfate sulfotransferase [Eudoraea sp.]|nr:aryl-sulfate sulfotransferase [Eudoraea sp.]